MDLYEEIVGFYLNVFEGCFLLPQAPVKLGENGKPLDLDASGVKWEAYPDFIAIDFRKPRIQIVEVTKIRDKKRVKQRIEEKLDASYVANIDHWVRTVLPESVRDLMLTRRFFLRSEVIPEPIDARAEFSSLQTVFNAVRDRMP